MDNIMLILLLILQAADVLTTIKALNLGGREGNSFLNGLFERFGVVPTLVVMKGSVAAFLIYWSQTATDTSYAIVMVAGILFYGWVIHNNLGIIKTLEAKKRR